MGYIYKRLALLLTAYYFPVKLGTKFRIMVSVLPLSVDSACNML
jgi:hypothetical protein